MGEILERIAKTYLDYPPRKLQSEGYTGPITISSYERFQHIREQLKTQGVKVTIPSG